jgi:hypothetical protein
VLGEGDLGVGTAGVVADQGRPAQVEALDRGGDQAGDSLRGEVGVGVHRRAVGAERQVEDEAAEVSVKDLDDLAPEVGVCEPAVAEEEGGTLAALEVVEGAAGKIERVRLAEQLRAPAMAAHAVRSAASRAKAASANGSSSAANLAGSLT